MNGMSWDLVDEGQVLEPIRTVAILGVGLIGGSIGLALRRAGSGGGGVGDRAGSGFARARRYALVPSTGRRPICARGSASAEVVVVCTPVNRVVEDVRRSAEAAGPDVLITDAGSSKRQIVEAVERQPAVLRRCSWGPTRRRLGAAGRGPRPGRPVRGPALRPDPDLADALRSAPPGGAGSGRAIGCRVLEMGPAEHDEVLAYTSHLPTPWPPPWPGPSRPTGSRWPPAPTATAPASPAPTPGLWTAIFRDNRGPLLKALDSLRDRLASFQYALDDRRRRGHPPLVGRGPAASGGVRRAVRRGEADPPGGRPDPIAGPSPSPSACPSRLARSRQDRRTPGPRPGRPVESSEADHPRIPDDHALAHRDRARPRAGGPRRRAAGARGRRAGALRPVDDPGQPRLPARRAISPSRTPAAWPSRS